MNSSKRLLRNQSEVILNRVECHPAVRAPHFAVTQAACARRHLGHLPLSNAMRVRWEQHDLVTVGARDKIARKSGAKQTLPTDET